MIADQHRRVKVLVEMASRRPPEERAAFLDSACRGDDALRAEVESLLACDTPTGGLVDPGEGWLADRLRELLGTGMGDPAGAADADEALVGRRIGRYQVARLLAAGGMGAVYEAEQESPRRTVALKIMRCALASRSAQRRFEYESQILASLRHPWIAQVYEAGVHREPGAPPLPWFAMELVPGATPITTYAREQGLDVRRRLELFAKVCEAVHHGAMKGIIHRDLKPSNILVDTGGEPKIIDFGVARATDSDLAATLCTEAGQLIGTLQYMSPEQVGGALHHESIRSIASIESITGGAPASPHDLDTRSDIYALGVVLYELLCGRPPYDVSACPVLDAARLIREAPPPRPATLDRSLRGDIETILLKALEKDRARRYQSALELGRDIRRFLAGEAILARPPSAAYQMRVFARRHKAAFGALAAVITVLAGAVVAVSILAVQLRAERDRAEAEATRALAAEADAEAIAEFQSGQLAGIDPAQMGQQIDADLEAMLRDSLARRGASPAEIETAAAELHRLLAELNPTDLALRTLEANYFDRTLAAIDDQFADRPLVQARLLQTVASMLRGLGLFDRAMAPITTAVEIRNHKLGETHVDTISSLIEIGFLLQRQDRHEEAEAYLRRAVAAARRGPGEAHRITVEAINAMGVLLHGTGKYAESEQLFREAMQVGRRVLDDNDKLAMTLIGNLGFALERQERDTEAEPLYRGTLARRQAKWGLDDGFTLWAVYRLGTVLRKQGRLEEAEQHLLEAVDGFARIRGNDYWRRQWALAELGMALDAAGRVEEAEKRWREAAASSRRSTPPAPGDTAVFLLGHARVLTALGRLSEAEENLLEARRMLQPPGVALPPGAKDLGAGDFDAALAMAFADLYEVWESRHRP
jgi:eukaryotic-like serine/threonine-protein kinase